VAGILAGVGVIGTKESKAVTLFYYMLDYLTGIGTPQYINLVEFGLSITEALPWFSLLAKMQKCDPSMPTVCVEGTMIGPPFNTCRAHADEM
jgi:hypothetical protein